MFTGREDHTISLAEAASMTKTYRQSMPSTARKGGFFGRDAIMAILNQEGCVGIRYYHGINTEGQPVIILCGATANEDAMSSGALVEFAIPCPTQCGASNPLNP